MNKASQITENRRNTKIKIVFCALFVFETESTFGTILITLHLNRSNSC